MAQRLYAARNRDSWKRQDDDWVLTSAIGFFTSEAAHEYCRNVGWTNYLVEPCTAEELEELERQKAGGAPEARIHTVTQPG